MPSEQTGAGVEGQREMIYRQMSETKEEYTEEKLSWKIYAKFLLKFSCSVNVGFAKKIMTKKRKKKKKKYQSLINSLEDNICLIYWR